MLSLVTALLLIEKQAFRIVQQLETNQNKKFSLTVREIHRVTGNEKRQFSLCPIDSTADSYRACDNLHAMVLRAVSPNPNNMHKKLSQENKEAQENLVLSLDLSTYIENQKLLTTHTNLNT